MSIRRLKASLKLPLAVLATVCGLTTHAMACEFVESGYGPAGQGETRMQQIATGLTVPWGIAFINDKDFLVTERPGRVRMFRDGRLVSEPVLRLNVETGGEGGLLGIAVHPDFSRNRLFYLYFTRRDENRVERFRLSADGRSASADRVIMTGIPAGNVHDGGRIHFGPDGHLYIATGDTRNSNLSQNLNSKGGKLLRVTADGEIPSGNPFGESPVFMLGIRNVQGFDWINSSTLILADHGPTGDTGRTGADEVSIARPGSNLGWPGIYRCEEASSRVTPILTWRQSVPPGGLVYYRGSMFPEWRGSAFIATLRSKHLHRVALNGTSLASHETLLSNSFGRLREVVEAPDGSLLVTTSNCDGRGSCPRSKDVILRMYR